MYRLRRGVLMEKRGGGGAAGVRIVANKPTLVLWHRAVRDRLVGFCSERYKDHVVVGLSVGFSLPIA